MRKTIFHIILLLGCTTITFAQITQQYSHFMFNQLPANPAAAGKDNALDAFGLFRAQWTGIEGNPSLQLLSVHSPLNVINSSAGLYIVNDILGAERSTHVMLAYAYRLDLKAGKLAFGLSGGIIQKSLDGSELRSPQGDYSDNTNINHNDQFIPDSKVSGAAPELNIGVYFNNRKLYAGVSVVNLIESKLKLETPNNTAELRFGRSYIAMAGYKIELGTKFALQPQAQLKTDLVNYQTDFNILLLYRNNIWGGFSFRGNSSSSTDALVAMFGFRLLKNFYVGYAYDFSLSSLNNVNNGSHEIFVNYRLNLKELAKPGKIIYNPRNL